MSKRVPRIVAAAVALAFLSPVLPATASSQLPVWGSVPSANRGNQANALLGTHIIGAEDVWAVGE